MAHSLTGLIQGLQRAQGLHGRIGEELAGSVLQCRTCEASRTITPAEAETYVASGWPTCCGATMPLHAGKHLS